MKDVFYSYIDFLLHPAKMHRELASNRERVAQLKKSRLFTLVDDDYQTQESLDFVSLVTVSWIFALFFALYSILFLHLGSFLTEWINEVGFRPGMAVASLFQKKVFLITMLGEVVFFPLASWVYVKFWKVLISFFGNIFEKDISEDGLNDVVNSSLVGNFFLLVPVFGKLIKTISSVIYIFVGIRNNLKFTAIQSAIVIVSPILFIALLMIFIVLYIMLVVNLY